jgi:hypothetical protein
MTTNRTEPRAVYFKQPNQAKVPIQLETHRWGPNGYVIIRSNDQRIYLPLVGNIAHLILALEETASQLRGMLCTQNEEGILRAHGAEEEIGFNFITLEDIAQAKTTSEIYALLIERFRTTLPDIAAALMQDYRTAVGRPYDGESDSHSSRLDQDLAEVMPIAAELVQDEELVWGAQSRIARRLGVTNAGSHRKRIKAVVQALLERSAA